MKTMIAIPVIFLLAFSSLSQIYEIEFEGYVGFNAGKLVKYEELIDTSNHVVSSEHRGGTNKYIIDLTKKTMERYFDDVLNETGTILSSKKVGDLVYMTITDVETLTGREIESSVVFNTTKTDSSHPLYMMYFISTVTQTTNGVIVWN